MAKKKLKIAFLNIYQNKTNRGGEVFVTELAKRLSKNHQVDIISGIYTRKLASSLLWRLFLDRNGIAVLLFTLKNSLKLLNNKYDIIIPLNGGFQSWIVRLLTWLTRSKMIIVGQSGIGWDDRHNLYSFPNTFVAISKKAHSWASRFNPFVNSVFIPNGVDLAKFTPKGKSIKTNLKPPIILSVGALVKQKRLDLVIKAVSRLNCASLLLVGEGPLHDELTALGKNLLGERFKIISVPHEKMPEIYRSADLFTLVSQEREAFGIVYVEALASGLPVVTTGDEIRRDIIGDAGLFINNPKNARIYAKVLSQALEKNWDTLPHSQSKNFSWNIIAKKYEQLFLNLVNHYPLIINN